MFDYCCGLQVHCSDTPEPHTYLVVRRTLRPNVKRLNVAVDETEICAALRLSPQEAEGRLHSPVFAFLPIGSYGWRFILQADFVLPSARESIKKDNEWNQRLREEVCR